MKVSNLLREIPVIAAVSSSSPNNEGDMELKDTAFQLGAASLITKPYDADDIIPRIKRLLTG